MKEETAGVQTFVSEQFGEIRTVEIDGEIWFVAADVCRALEMSNPRKAVSDFPEDEKMTVTNSDGHSGKRGGAQKFNLVNEPGLYRLIFKSRKPEAKKFQRWVYHEVLPSIRKTGEYKTDEMKDDGKDNDRLLKVASLMKDDIRRESLLEEIAFRLTGKHFPAREQFKEDVKSQRPRRRDSKRKFTDEQADEIRRKYFQGKTLKGLAEEYGTARTIIYRIVNFQTYR